MSEATTTRSYRPGTWFGVFGDHATVLLPPSEKARVARLWELVDEGAGFDEVLDALIAGGLRELPGFVLISELEADTKVVIRGPARARFTAGGETVELHGSTATTWVEQTLTDVTAMSVEVDGATEGGEELSVENGLVRVATVTAPPAAPAGESGPGPDADEVPATAVETGSAPQPVDAGPATEAMAAPAPPSPAGAHAGPREEASDHDGMTRAGAGDEPPYAPPGIPGQPQAPSVVSRPVARLLLSSGETVDVDRVLVIGRAPEARRFPAEEQPRLVTVPSPQQEISSTHLEVRPGSGADHGSAVATDLGSTNGTVVVQPGLPPEDLRPGIAVQLIPGAVIDLGDGVTIQVVNP